MELDLIINFNQELKGLINKRDSLIKTKNHIETDRDYFYQFKGMRCEEQIINLLKQDVKNNIDEIETNIKNCVAAFIYNNTNKSFYVVERGGVKLL